MKWLVGAIIAGIAMPAEAARWTWDAPATCPDEDALHRAVGARLEASLDDVPLVITVRIDANVDTFTAHLEVHGPVEDSRELTSPSCAELTDAVGLVIARLASTLASPRPHPEAPAMIQRPAVAETRSAWNGGLRVSGMVGTGGAPGVGIAGELGAWLAWRSWTVAISGARWSSSTAMLDGTMSGVDVALQALAVRTGWRPESRWLRVWLVGELGSIRGDGVGLEQHRGGTARWSAAGAGAGIALALAPQVSAVVASEAELVLDRARFTVGDGTVIYRTPAFAVRGSVGLEVSWR